MKDLVATAELLARTYHSGQKRRDGVTSYIRHIEGVVKRVESRPNYFIMTAWLHDILEDTDCTVETLKASFIPDPVIEAVQLLTRCREVPNDLYLERIYMNDIARAVKIADMLHNLSDSPTEKQIRKYCHGLLKLVD